jgi:hypothetical protein
MPDNRVKVQKQIGFICAPFICDLCYSPPDVDSTDGKAGAQMGKGVQMGKVKYWENEREDNGTV